MELKSALAQPVLAAVLISLGLVSPALSRSSLMVKNCKDSHHQIYVSSGSTKTEAAFGEFDSKRISPGSSKMIKCGGCYLNFTTAAGTSLYKKGDSSEYYIHVKKSYEFSETTDGSNCD